MQEVVTSLSRTVLVTSKLGKLKQRNTLTTRLSRSTGPGESPVIADARVFEKEVVSAALPHIVRADHYETAPGQSKVSFPLLAMQFVLRHFVSCLSLARLDSVVEHKNSHCGMVNKSFLRHLLIESYLL